MTATTIISAVPVGALGAYGTNPTKTTLQATTTAFSVNVSLTNGAVAGNPSKTVRVYAACSEFSITAAQATAQLKRTAAILELSGHESPGGTNIEVTPLLGRTGSYVYAWTEEPTFTVAGILSVILYELN
jgi:hypothetical protein